MTPEGKGVTQILHVGLTRAQSLILYVCLLRNSVLIAIYYKKKFLL